MPRAASLLFTPGGPPCRLRRQSGARSRSSGQDHVRASGGADPSTGGHESRDKVAAMRMSAARQPDPAQAPGIDRAGGRPRPSRCRRRSQPLPMKLPTDDVPDRGAPCFARPGICPPQTSTASSAAGMMSDETAPSHIQERHGTPGTLRAQTGLEEGRGKSPDRRRHRDARQGDAPARSGSGRPTCAERQSAADRTPDAHPWPNPIPAARRRSDKCRPARYAPRPRACRSGGSGRRCRPLRWSMPPMLGEGPGQRSDLSTPLAPQHLGNARSRLARGVRIRSGTMAGTGRQRRGRQRAVDRRTE